MKTKKTTAKKTTAKKTTAKKTTAKKTTAKKTSAAASNSRRGIIIYHLQSKVATRAAILSNLKKKGWKDNAKNSKAISGTISDLRKNKSAVITTNKTGVYAINMK